MNRTKSKYNRYTRFAFVFLDSFLLSLDAMGSHYKHSDSSKKWWNSIRKQIWNDISSVEFISDYLQRPLLLHFQGPATTAIELIMCDAVGSNDTLNTDRLSLMVHHPRILFNFNVIYFELIESPIWNEKTRAECLEFIVHHELITWSVMEERANAYEAVYPANDIIRSMCRYVRCRSRGFSVRSACESGNPLSGKTAARSISFEKSVPKNNACCLCM